MKFLGMNIVPMLNPLKFSITTPLNFQNMQSVSMPVQVFWNLELIPIKGNWFSSKHFLPCSPLSCVSVAQISTLEGGYVSAIAKYSRTLSYASLGISNPHRENPPVTELRDTLKHMNDSWQRLIQTKRFKSGVAGFLRTTEVTRGNDGDMMAHPHFHALLLVKPSYFKGQGYIKQADWVEMWAKALRADYLPSVNVKAVKATLMKKDASNSIKQLWNAQIQRKTVWFGFRAR